MVMELSYQQTLQLYANLNIVSANKRKYSYTTKVKAQCLSCLTPIFISFKQYGIQNIFCKSCYSKYQTKPTIVQYQYMRVIKENQLMYCTENLTPDGNN